MAGAGRRSKRDILDLLDEKTRAGLAADPGGFRQPMLATLTERRFSDDNWLFERKLDGVRTLAVRDRGTPQLWSRNEKRVDASYPEVVEALTAMGEVVRETR